MDIVARRLGARLFHQSHHIHHHYQKAFNRSLAATTVSARYASSNSRPPSHTTTSGASSSSVRSPPPPDAATDTNEESEDPTVAAFLTAIKESSDNPDLMEGDPLLDFALTMRFPPDKHSPYHGNVIVRNEPSMFVALQDMLKEQNPEYAKQLEQEKATAEKSADRDNPLHFLHLSQSELRDLFQYRLDLNRVTQQTGKGKVSRYSAMTVVGNGKGLVGYGEGKDEEVPRAQAKSLIAAVRNMDYIARFEERTFYTNMEHKFGSTRVFLRPRPVGFGLHCNPNVHQVLKAAGIRDASAKVWGSRNPRRVVKALFQMLHPSHVPILMGDGIGGPARRLDKGYGARTKEEVERERGRRLIAMRM